MSVYNLGRVLPIFKGEYNPTETYENLDVVLYNGSSYVAINTTTNNLPTDENHWVLLALAGNISPEQIAEVEQQVIEYVQSQGYVIDDNYVHTDNNYSNTDKAKVDNAVVDPDYIHTDNNFTDEEKTKLDGIDMTTKQDTLVSGTNIKSINNQSILGSGNIEIEGVSDYEELTNKPSINGTTLVGNVNLATPEQLNAKQDTLESGTNIKTINNESLLGSGNIEIEPHFKGWFDNLTSLQTKYSSPVVGDYGYVKGATTTDPVKIYECTTNGTWSDSGREFNSANDQSFATGQAVNDVKIKDENGENVSGPADVLSAWSVVPINDFLKINNLQIAEQKATFTPVFKYYSQWDGGDLIFLNNNLCAYADVQIPAGFNKVRFLGLKYASETCPNLGYIFYNGESYVLGHPMDYDAGLSQTELKEYIVDIPDGVTKIRFNVVGSSRLLNEDNFYCYFIKETSKATKESIFSKALTSQVSAIPLLQGLMLSTGHTYPVEQVNFSYQRRRVVTPFIFVNGKATITVTNGILFNVYFYADSDENTYERRAGQWIETGSYELEHVGYIKIVFRNQDGSNLTVHNFSASISYASMESYEQQLLGNYIGREVKVKLGSLTLAMGKSTYLGQLALDNNQSFLIYDGKFISISVDSYSTNVAVVDSSFNLVSSKHLAIGHGNAFQLGSNGKAYVSGWDDNKVHVVDLATLTVESSISLPVSGYTTVAVDDLNHLMYIFHRETRPNTVENYLFTVYNYDTDTILSTKTIEAFSFMQSVDFYQGKIYMCWGAPQSPYYVASGMRVYNTAGDVLYDIDIDVFKDAEPEGIFVDRENGDMYVSGVKNVYKIEMP